MVSSKKNLMTLVLHDYFNIYGILVLVISMNWLSMKRHP